MLVVIRGEIYKLTVITGKFDRLAVITSKTHILGYIIGKTHMSSIRLCSDLDYTFVLEVLLLI